MRSHAGDKVTLGGAFQGLNHKGKGHSHDAQLQNHSLGILKMISHIRDRQLVLLDIK